MINQEFGGEHTIDIHGGGTDLKFPHHEDKIAQSRVAYDSPIASYWIHNGIVNIDREKMSKSPGNVIWVENMIAKIGGNVLHWVMLSTYYRALLNINKETTEVAKEELNRMATVVRQAYVRLGLADVDMDETYDGEQLAPFPDAMQDNMDTLDAFAAVFETVKTLNQAPCQRETDLQVMKILVRTLEGMMDVLDVEFLCLTTSEEDKQLHRQWRAAAKEKGFETADQYCTKSIGEDTL